MKNNIFVSYEIFITIIFFICSANLEAKQVNNDEVKGVAYFSNGTDLIKYNFSSKKEEKLFGFQENSELGRRITQIMYPVYLKNKNKILFIGSNTYDGFSLIFESDLNLKQWKEYKNTTARDLSLSPDESMVSYYKYPDELLIKKYEDLEKEGCEKIVAKNAATGGRPLWISNFEIIFHSKTNDIVKVNIDTGTQQIVVNNLFPESISPDKKYMICSNKDSIYLYDMVGSQLKLLKKGMYFNKSSPNIWSPDGKYFLYSKGQEIKFKINIVDFMNSLTAEKRDICIYNLNTGKDEKLLENEDAIFGGFWVE